MMPTAAIILVVYFSVYAAIIIITYYGLRHA